MIKKLKTEIQKVIIGQEDLVDHLLIGLIAGGIFWLKAYQGWQKPRQLILCPKPWESSLNAFSLRQIYCPVT
ncbi:hypothetical protein BSPWISOXPB_2237 [uncultured Gammaproteobacteria bacterium]|nr:hypothetical protein BSPWISOXPB_2237 [uncultured Gammaproteobacteria bacterium]